MAEGLCGTTPSETFQLFNDHLNTLLHKTITEFPLVRTKLEDRALLEFRQDGKGVAVDVGKGYHLYINQSLRAKKIGKRDYRLQTLAYAYRVAEGPNFDDPWIVRWEYNSREKEQALHPRHHCHLAFEKTCFGDRQLSFSKMHIASGWVTIEEVIRFLIHELGVRPKDGY